MPDHPRPQISTFTLGDFQTNCFVVDVPEAEGEAGRRCWIVDCGYDAEPMLDHIAQQGLQPEAILLTHTHADHIASLELARQRFGDPPVYVHEAERGFCSDPMLNLSAALGEPISAREPERTLKDGDTLELAGTTWRVVHAPGHSPGGVLFVHDGSQQAIVGDTLFAGGIGRFDFPTSDQDALRHTIHETLMSLPDGMTIHPGHGPSTTIGQERRSNPFITQGF